MYTINLGTGNINDAVSIIEYTNFEGGTYWSDLRKKYGHEKPYGVKTWYLGNEMDGPWQIASWEKNPSGYGILANEVSKAMKWVDGSIETAVCASSSPFLAHYPQWEMDVLQECYEAVDYISLHHYHTAPEGDFAALLAGPCYMEDYVNTEIAVCDFVQAKLRSPKQLMLSFDEYGCRIGANSPLTPGRNPHNLVAKHYRFDAERKYVRHNPADMGEAWERHRKSGDMVNTLTAASTMLMFIRHADRVKIGCMTGGLAALAASNGDHVWKAASNYSFTDLIKYGRGISMQTSVQCDTFDVPGYAIDDGSQYATKENIPFIDTAAAYDEENGELNIFVVNRNWESDISIDLDITGFDSYKFIEHTQLYSDDFDAKNSYENPSAIAPSVSAEAKYENSVLSSVVKKLSWNVFRFKK